MAKKQIGIVGWSTGDNSFGVTKAYLEYLSKFGDVQILTPRKDIYEGLDLIVLPGGKDTLSSNYDEAPGYTNSDSDAFKEYFVKKNLPQYIAAGIPIFGICLGFQQLCAHFGCKITQNLFWDHGYSTKSRGELVHKVHKVTHFNEELQEWQYSKANNNTYETNSLHHQGILLDQISNLIQPLYVTEDVKDVNVVEVMKHKELPIYGVQYHPEEIWDKVSNNIIKSLLNGD